MKTETILKQFLRVHYPTIPISTASLLEKQHPNIYLHYHRYVAKLKYDQDVIKARNDVRLKKALKPEMYANVSKRFHLLTVNNDGTITKEYLINLLNDTEYCPYCDIALNIGDKSFDHLDPISKGGIHSITNIIVCCVECNQLKKAMPFDKFVLQFDQEKQQRLINMYEHTKKAGPLSASCGEGNAYRRI